MSATWKVCRSSVFVTRANGGKNVIADCDNEQTAAEIANMRAVVLMYEAALHLIAEWPVGRQAEIAREALRTAGKR